MKPIIDFHTHAFADAIAERAIAALEAKNHTKPETDGTVRGLIDVMDDAGVAQSVILSIATKPAHASVILDWSLEIASKRIVPFASVHPDSTDLANEIQAIVDAGIKGLKLHPLYQNFAVDDPRVFPLYEMIADSGLVLLMHAGYDIAFGEDDLALPERFVSVLDNFPTLRLVMAHGGGWRCVDGFIEHLAGRNVAIDTSFLVDYTSPEQRAALLARHDTERIVFGSDSPWGSMRDHIALIESLPVDDATKERILFGNAERLLSTK
jgi:predicted TIM-barrel fold metal-dependent hydrolase